MTGADLSQLNGRDLDVVIARAAGWGEITHEQYPPADGDYDDMDWWGVPPDWDDADGDGATWIPEFSTSLDALSGPEKVLLDAGWWLTVRRDKSGATARWENDATYFHSYCDTEAESRARACLDALICEGDGLQ